MSETLHFFGIHLDSGRQILNKNSFSLNILLEIRGIVLLLMHVMSSIYMAGTQRSFLGCHSI